MINLHLHCWSPTRRDGIYLTSEQTKPDCRARQWHKQYFRTNFVCIDVEQDLFALYLKNKEIMEFAHVSTTVKGDLKRKFLLIQINGTVE